MAKSADYWKKRFSAIESAEHKTGMNAYAEIEKQYQEAQRAVSDKLAVWYDRLAKNNDVSLQEAKKLLSRGELKEFKWDVDDYIKYGRENAINQQWMKELENASARAHISRLEAMKLQMQQQVEVLFGNQLDTVDKTMRDVYEDGYYRTAYEIQKGVGVGTSLARLDTRKIDKVINQPWAQDGSDFSSRIWKNKDTLVQQLNTTLTQNIIRGEDPQKAIDAIAKRMDVSKTAAGRLVMTEEAAFSSSAQKDCFKELGVEKYEIVVTLDDATCDECAPMDGMVFKMSEYEPGSTAPPFHCYCRCTTVPHFDDDFGSVGERAARDGDGKTYYVPADMAYKEWKAEYVENQEKESSFEQSRKIHSSTNVNWEIVDSANYGSGLYDIDGINEDSADKLIQKSRDMLEHRDGTEYEDMYLIDSVSGEVAGSQTKTEYSEGSDENKILTVAYNKDLLSAIKKYPKNQLIALHNHPNSKPPSGSDFQSLYDHHYKCGLIACHDGSMYYYRIGKSPIHASLYDMEVDKFKKMNYSEIKAYELALQSLKEDYDIDWRKL